MLQYNITVTVIWRHTAHSTNTHTTGAASSINTRLSLRVCYIVHPFVETFSYFMSLTLRNA